MTRNQKKKLAAAANSSSSVEAAMDSQNFQPVVGLRASIHPSAASNLNKSSDFAEKHSVGQRDLGSSPSKAPSSMASVPGSQQAIQPVAAIDKSMTMPSDTSMKMANSEPQIEVSRSSNKKIRERSKSIDEQRTAAANQRAADDIGSPVLVSHGLDVGKISATISRSDSCILKAGLPVFNTNLSNAGPVCSHGSVGGLDTAKLAQAPTVVNMQVDGAAGVASSGSHLTVCSRELVNDTPVVNMQVDGHISCAHLTDCSRLSAENFPILGTDKGDSGPAMEVPPNGRDKHASSSKAPWLEAVKNNRKVEFMGKLTEITEGVTDIGVGLIEKDVLKEEELEARCLIGMFNGKFPGIDMVQKMVNNWPKRCIFQFHNSGWIVFKFENASDLQQVLQSASFYAANKPMVVKKMPRFFHFSKEEYSLVPTWIQLPNLPLSCWTKEALGKICTFVGLPLYVDKLTKNQESISFARCLIEVDARERLPNAMILTMPDGKKLDQKILYEDRPKWCKKCNRLGHLTEECYATAIPEVAVYVAKSRAEATQTKRGRSRKRRGSSRPKNNVSANAKLNAIDIEQNKLDRIEEIVQAEVENVIGINSEIVKPPAVAVDLPLNNSFSIIDSWAEESDKAEGNKGHQSGAKSVSSKGLGSVNGTENGNKAALHGIEQSRGKEQSGKSKTGLSNPGIGKSNAPTLKPNDPRGGKPPFKSK